MSNSKPISTPCCTDVEYDESKGLQSGYLQSSEATAFRGIAARINYLALDRPNLQFAAKDIAKHMARPIALDWIKIKRAGRYLKGCPRYVQVFNLQEGG